MLYKSSETGEDGILGKAAVFLSCVWHIQGSVMTVYTHMNAHT